jgi:hypothetical protein
MAPGVPAVSPLPSMGKRACSPLMLVFPGAHYAFVIPVGAVLGAKPSWVCCKDNSSAAGADVWAASRILGPDAMSRSRH